MMKVILAVALACGVGFSQVTPSKLNGKRIYVSRQEGGHQGGYDGFRQMLEANKAKYGYNFEYSAQPLSEAQLNAVFDRLYKPGVTTRPANTIDVLIFCQGEGDRNVGGGQQTVPFPGAPDRMAKVNAHVRNGGVLISVHGAGGREVSWHNWVFGAMLMTDWFVDGYLASPVVTGNAGHFSARTAATYTLDEETLPAKDSSTYFIRKLLTGSKTGGAFGQPLVTSEVKGEWYHYNAGKQYEDGSGNPVSHANNKLLPKPVRGNAGVPDSGIGPARIVGILTKIGANYTPPGKGRHSVWVREVSKGKFDPKAVKENGRYVLFNPGHDGDEWTQGNNWMGDFFMSTLRWAVKDDLGCTNPSKPAQYNPHATVDDGETCPSTSLIPEHGPDAGALFGKVMHGQDGLEIAIEKQGPHTVKVVTLDGSVAFERSDVGVKVHKAAGIQRGTYLVLVGADGRSFSKMVTVR